MFLAVGLFSWMIWQQADQGLRAELLSQAQRSADAINLDYLNALSGTPEDQQLPEYEYLKRQLMLTRQVFPESRFLYLMGQKSDGDSLFLLSTRNNLGLRMNHCLGIAIRISLSLSYKPFRARRVPMGRCATIGAPGSVR
jgi:hypothetical protein